MTAKKYFGLGILLLLTAILLSGCVQQQPSTNQPNTVTIKNFAFSPSTITIKAGTTVTWTNEDSAPHTVTSDSGSELNSQELSNGQSYSHTFNQAGTFEYHCGLHPSMKAKVIVE